MNNFQDQKKIQEQLLTEQETFFGSRPSPNNKPLGSAKKQMNGRSNGSVDMPASTRRLSLASTQGNVDTLLPRVNGVTPVRIGKDGKRERPRPSAPVNFVALSKEVATVSVPSSMSNESEPTSPIAV